jgi:hypothetical protein
LGIFWALEWIILVYFMVNWNILRSMGIFYSHLVYIVVICYIFSLFGILYQEKSGNPGLPFSIIQCKFFCLFSLVASNGLLAYWDFEIHLLCCFLIEICPKLENENLSVKFFGRNGCFVKLVPDPPAATTAARCPFQSRSTWPGRTGGRAARSGPAGLSGVDLMNQFQLF